MGEIMIAARCFIASLLYIQIAKVDRVYLFLFVLLFICCLLRRA